MSVFLYYNIKKEVFVKMQTLGAFALSHIKDNSASAKNESLTHSNSLLSWVTFYMSQRGQAGRYTSRSSFGRGFDSRRFHHSFIIHHSVYCFRKRTGLPVPCGRFHPPTRKQSGLCVSARRAGYCSAGRTG